MTRTRSCKRYGGSGHQAEVYAGSGGRFVPTTASGCASPGSGPSSGSRSSGVGEVVAVSVAETQIRQPAPVGGGGGSPPGSVGSKVRPQDPGGGAARIAIPQEAVNMEMRSLSVLSVVAPQSVPSRILVVLVEEAEVRGAECLASAPVNNVLRLLAGAACPASVTVCEDCVISPGVVGTLSPSDSDSVGPVGPYGKLSPSDSDSVGLVGPDGALSSSDLAGILFPAVPAGIPFPVGPVGPVGLCGTLSPSDSDSVGPVGPYETLSPSDSDSVGLVGPDGALSSSDLAGILFPAVPAGIPFPVGPVGPVALCGTLSPSDSDSDGPVGPDGTLSSSDLAGILLPAVPSGILFPVGPDTDNPLPPVVFSSQLFWDEDIAEPSRMLSDCGDVPVTALQVFVGSP